MCCARRAFHASLEFLVEGTVLTKQQAALTPHITIAGSASRRVLCEECARVLTITAPPATAFVAIRNVKRRHCNPYTAFITR